MRGLLCDVHLLPVLRAKAAAQSTRPDPVSHRVRRCVTVPSPRFYHCQCHDGPAKTFSPLTDLLPGEHPQRRWQRSCHELVINRCDDRLNPLNTFRSNTPNGWAKLASNLPSAALGTAMTTRWLKRSMAYSRLRSFTAAAHRATSKPWNTQRSNGWIGSTTAACLNRSGTFRRQKQRPISPPLWKLRTLPRN